MFQSYLAIGNLGADPEMRYTQDGKAVTNFRLAVNEGYGDKQSVFWVSVVCWEKTAEAAAEYLRKGSLVMIQGRWQARSWKDKEGNERVSYEVVAHTLKFLSPRKREDGDEEPQEEPRQQTQRPAARSAAPRQDSDLSDLPF